jgi:hypothetical protein
MAVFGSVSAVGGDQRVSGDIRPGPRELLIRLDPLSAPRRTQALAALCDSSPPPALAIPAPTSSCATRSNPAQAPHKDLYVEP